MPWRALPTATIRICDEVHDGHQACCTAEQAAILLPKLSSVPALQGSEHRGALIYMAAVGAKLPMSARQAETEYVAVLRFES